jgi:hypothetical protein
MSWLEIQAWNHNNIIIKMINTRSKSAIRKYGQLIYTLDFIVRKEKRRTWEEERNEDRGNRPMGDLYGRKFVRRLGCSATWWDDTKLPRLPHSQHESHEKSAKWEMRVHGKMEFVVTIQKKKEILSGHWSHSYPSIFNIGLVKSQINQKCKRKENAE